jgi:preprotein translocase subunit SecG
MDILIVIIHVIVCVALIMIVLLQTGKGADMGAAFGGGASQTLFGTTGASTFLSKATTAAAIIFMLTSLILAYSRSTKDSSDLVRKTPPAVEQTEGDQMPVTLPGDTDNTLPAATEPQTDTQTPAAEPSTQSQEAAPTTAAPATEEPKPTQ